MKQDAASPESVRAVPLALTAQAALEITQISTSAGCIAIQDTSAR
jgi:hypothetical protein